MKKRILVIEGDNDIRDIVSYILSEEGYHVVTAKPWPVNQLHNHKADLILLDEWINEKEGHLLCTELKDLHETQHVPVIIFSTQMNIADIAKKCRAEGYVHKPFNLDDLLSEIQKCLSAHVV
ncbi:response regulator [Mucilaginibacter lacusdianchii]|uniref:response regulator n=1 Tax=Mucilaginibacter lacusdianchii TaxID=2684211 RepID=UPI00131ABC9F|nr:response regulator [Mucilaginibacter sp. JXJ CY 39]